MTQDKNGKELGIGDEVVLHFRVVEAGLRIEPAEDSVYLESMHNRHSAPIAPDGSGFVDEEVIPLYTKAFRVILQKKAKLDSSPPPLVP